MHPGYVPGQRLSNGFRKDELLKKRSAINRASEKERAREEMIHGTFTFDVYADGGIRLMFVNTDGPGGALKTIAFHGSDALQSFMTKIGFPLSADQLAAARNRKPLTSIPTDIDESLYKTYFM